MGIDGHNIFQQGVAQTARRVIGTALALTLSAGLVVPATALAAPPVSDQQQQSSDTPMPGLNAQISTLSSESQIRIPELPVIEVPAHLRDAAGGIGISLPEQIDLNPARPAAAKPVDAKQLAVASEIQLAREGHSKDARAAQIAQEWAQQAADGQATFTGNVGRGVTGLEEGTGNIYRLTPKAAQERLAFLNRDQVVEDVETTPVPQPKRFGVATSEKGDTIYLVEYFLN